METIQVVLDAKLLKAADAAAKRQKTNRSALIRRALQEHLKRTRIEELERQERLAYEDRPDRLEEFEYLRRGATWPED
jgi:metal-responsive CopG/Arc/MetJ family transcriptional regulator